MNLVLFCFLFLQTLSDSVHVEHLFVAFIVGVSTLNPSPGLDLQTHKRQHQRVHMEKNPAHTGILPIRWMDNSGRDEFVLKKRVFWL